MSTGRVSGPELQEAWRLASENRPRLDGCARHEFAPEAGQGIATRWVCSACRGTADDHAVRWYRLGLGHR